MTKREKLLLKILIVIIIFCIFFLSNRYLTDGMNDNIQNKEKYEKFIFKANEIKLQQQEEQAVYEIINESEKTEEINMSELLELILNDLRRYNIRPGRYQINSKGINEYVDFTIKCSAYQLTNYLESISDGVYSYTISSISIKTEEEGVSASIRYELIPSKVILSNMSAQKSVVQKILRSPYRPTKEKPVEKKEEPVQIEESVVEEVIVDGANNYKIIGYIKDNNDVNNLYIKSKTGRMLKISPEEIVEEDFEKYIIMIDGNKTKIKK